MKSDSIKLIKFFIGHSRSLVLLSIASGIIAGASSAVLIMMINARVVGIITSQATSVRLFIAFAVIALVATTASGLLATHLSQKTSFQMRMIICRRILDTPLRQMEKLGAHSVLAALTQDVPIIISAFTRVPPLFINIAIVTGCLIYLAFLSWQMFLVLIAFVLLGVFSYVLPQRIGNRYLKLAREEYDTLIKHFRALLKGAKELKLHYNRRHEFLSKLVRPTAASMRHNNVVGSNVYVLLNSWSQVLYFLVIGFILFALSDVIQNVNTRILTGYALTVLYMSGPIQSLVATIPTFSTATISLKKLENLGLSSADRDLGESEARYPDAPLAWERLDLEQVTHSYYREREDDNFTFGPIDLSIYPGELIFVTGGNGSGKTTFIKLLAGLYIPEAGRIRLDGTPVTDENIECFRQYFSVVFTEFHVFEQLLGLARPELDEQAQALLKSLQLGHKVKVTDGQLSTTELSYGQRKRLALLTAFLEDRPFYVFDEWAADQDPEFKEIFYLHLLPELKARGKTLFVISHDDKYYHLADRIIRLDYGKIEYDRRLNEAPQAAAQMELMEVSAARFSNVGVTDLPLPRTGAAVGKMAYQSFEEYSTQTKIVAEKLNGDGHARANGNGFWAQVRKSVAPADEPVSLSKTNIVLGLLACLFIAALIWMTIYQLKPPAAATTAPPEQFASGRAMQHLNAIARQPRPTGSSAHADVRNHLMQALSGLGLKPEIQESTAVRRGRSSTAVVNVKNVWAVLEGNGANRQALMLVAHYDSAPTSPGASDDGAAVAALLETARALKSGSPLKNDVVLLFTDAEELGLLGAKAFVAEHPLAKQVKLAFNFEARGSRGPVFMFETSERNGWLMREFGKVAPAPFASSLMYAVYKLLPNDTDFTVFKKAGISGLNFAHIDGANHYHTARDSLQTVDERSLQHHGSYATALARHFGNLNLENTAASDDAIYFDLFGSKLVSYAETWVLPLVVVTVLLYAGIIVAALRKKRLTIVGIIAGFLAFVLSLAAAAAAATLLLWGLRSLGHVTTTRHTHDQYYFLGIIALTLCITATLYLSFNKRISMKHLHAGALFGWLILAVTASISLPGASYLLIWPLLFSLVAFACGVFGQRLRAGTVWWFGLTCLCVVPGILLFSAVTYNLYTGLGFAIPALLAAPVVLLLGLLVPYLSYIALPYRLTVPVLSLAACLVFLFLGYRIPLRSSEDPQSNAVLYSVDMDRGEAVWITDSATRLDEWTSQFFPANAESRSLPNHFPHVNAKFLVSNARNTVAAADEIRVLEDQFSNGVRVLRLRLFSPRGARIIYLYLEPEV
ncbi:MAG TPA: cyclic peptide export ABC transporter, partial [Pyrinomonadaceae bacterium]|nr:cyclic peptide export ABC transporter [Pyrinomonadaceae bacterium]